MMRGAALWLLITIKTFSVFWKVGGGKNQPFEAWSKWWGMVGGHEWYRLVSTCSVVVWSIWDITQKKLLFFLNKLHHHPPLLKSFFKKKTCLKGLTSKNKEKDLLINFIQVMLLHVMATRVLSLLGVWMLAFHILWSVCMQLFFV